MIRAAIVTSVERGFASLCLPALAAQPGVEVAVVVLVEGPPPGRWPRIRRMARKAWRIGPLGAINGLRMRRWYGADVADRLGLEPLGAVAARLGVPFETSPALNGERTAELLRRAHADIGLSLGNAWIAPRIFSIPRLGMLNVHHELLPEFQGAQSVVWSLHEGRTSTGYTIHRVSRGIDEGDIVVRQELPVVFEATLAATVTATCAALQCHSADRLAAVVADIEPMLAQALPQGVGRRWTTPSWSAYRRIRRAHDALRRAVHASPVSSDR